MILWSNLLTDGLLGLGMGVERAERDGPAIGTALIVLGWIIWEQVGGTAAQVTNGEEALLATVVFTSLAFGQFARALASRSFHEPIWRTGLRGDPVLIGMLAAALALQLAVVYLPFAQDISGTRTLAAAQLAVGAGLALAILVRMEVEKALRGRSTPSAPERRQLAADLA